MGECLSLVPLQEDLVFPFGAPSHLNPSHLNLDLDALLLSLQQNRKDQAALDQRQG